MVKKLSGILLIALGGLLTLGALNSLYTLITVPIKKTGDSAYDSGQAFGGWFFMILISAVIFYLFKFGFKLVKKKEITIESINDIGSGN